MNLYLLTQDVNDDYETYDALVVAAKNEEEARMIHPKKKNWDGEQDDNWAPAKKVVIKLIGKAIKNTSKGVIIASYNAG